MSVRRQQILATAALVAFASYLVCELVFGFPASFTESMSNAWGRTVFVDLYIGLLLFGFLVIHREKSLAGGTTWLLLFLVFGNLATLAYVIKSLRSGGFRQGGTP